MAKEKVNVDVDEVSNVVNENDYAVSIPVVRDEYIDRKTKKTMYEYHCSIEVKGHPFKIKISCIEKDIQLFEVLAMMFDFGQPKLVRELSNYENPNTGELVETYRYYVISKFGDELMKIRVKPMKESDKMVAEIEFDRLEKELGNN